ncbi:MAG: apolipoprotein N-acyltransferase [Actinomycetota bacterium]
MQEVLPGQTPEPAGRQEEDALPGLRLRARPSLAVSLPIALASGLLVSAAFPPLRWWPVAFVGVAPFLWLLRSAGGRRGAALGFAFGLGCYGATLYWILLFGEMAWVALTLLCTASAVVFGLLAPVVHRRGRPVLTAVGLAALWTVMDWVRTMWPLGGFSWGALGVSQVDNRATVRLATITGVWGVTFVVVVVNALLVETVAGGGGGRRRAGRLGLAALSIAAPLLIPFSVPDGRDVDVATLQVDVRQAASISTITEDEGVARLHIALHARLTSDPPDLAVWGEGALDPGAANDPRIVADVRRVIATVGAPTLAGAVLDDPDGTQRTSVVLFDGEGDLVDRYDKVHLVPFGEYVPWRRELSWISAIQQIPVDRTPGERAHTLSTAGLPSFAAPICFENSFPALTRAFVRAGAGFLVVPVNNASYGTTAASAQHLQMSQMRAVEDGRWVVDAAVSGISAFVDPSGRVVAQAGLFLPTIVRHTVRSSDVTTPYVRLGDWLPWVSLMVVTGMLLVPRRRSGARPAPDPLSPDRRRTLVILPTYEERDTIEWVLARLIALRERVDVLVVDDSSPDGTADLVRAVAADEPRVRLLERPRKLGLASAYLDGFRVGLADGYDLLVEMDSDLSHEPEELPRLLAAAAIGRDMVVGSRYVPGGSVTDWSRSRVGLSKAGNTYARLMLGLPIRDATSGFRVYRRRALEVLVTRPFHSDGYGFQIELVMRAWNAGYDVGEVPITFREREHGHSKISRTIVVEALWLVTVWGVKARFTASRSDRPDEANG